MATNKYQETQNENIILDDYLELIRCSYPHCNCGKCISKKFSHNPPPNYKYDKNINSSYKKEYKWKENEKKGENENINRNIKLHETNILKNNHLKDSLISTMKKDFNKNSKNEENLIINSSTKIPNKKDSISEYQNNLRNSINGNNINNCNDKDKRPFIGRSNYDSMFPNWQLSKNQMDQNEKKPRENIPFNGNSNYKEKFIRHEDIFYSNKRSPILNSDSLENKGEMFKESTFKEDFKPINYEEFRGVNTTPKKRENWIVSGPYCKNSFLSSYEKAFMYNNLSIKKERGTINNFIY